MSQQQQFVSPQEVRREIDFIEDLMGGLSSDDEYLQAILHNQKMMGMLMLQMVEGSDGGAGPAPSDPTNLDVGAVGIAAEGISSSSTGVGVFNAKGSWYSVGVNAQQQINEDDIIVVNGQDNEVIPSTDISRDHLNIVSDFDISSDPESPDPQYEAYNNITVEDGTENLLEWNFPADSVAIYNISANIEVAFKKPSESNRKLLLRSADDPFSITGVNGLKATRLWYESASGADETVNVIVVGYPEQ
jgi:hypothetical protein